MIKTTCTRNTFTETYKYDTPLLRQKSKGNNGTKRAARCYNYCKKHIRNALQWAEVTANQIFAFKRWLVYAFYKE